MGQSSAISINLASAAETGQLAAHLASALPDASDGMLILLKGELGSGKSTLARAMLRALGHRGTVPSPTYTLVEPYQLPGRTIYHVDLYRISDASELTFLGWDELRDGLMLVEWPERAEQLYAQADLLIELEYAADGRVAHLTGSSERGNNLATVACANY